MEKEKTIFPRPLSIFWLLLFLLGCPAGASAEERATMIKYSRMDSCFHNFNSTTTACMYGRTFYFTRSFITRACTWCTTTKEFFSSTWLTTDHMWTTSNKVLRKKKRSNVFSKSMSRSGVTLYHTARVANTCLWIIKLLHDIETLSVVQ